MSKVKVLTRTVWILSLVSFFTDIGSEMLYPVMPIYLKSIGFSVVLIGVLEGVAEATAGLSKGYFGKMSDNTGKRIPFVRGGYALSAIAKPMLAAFTYPLWIFISRTLERLGKGIRTGARDAMLSDETDAKNKGKVFGFHRSMDTLGAFVGPISALVYLYYRPGDYTTLFLIAFIPGVAAFTCTYFLKDKNAKPKESVIKTSFFDFIKYWQTGPKAYRKLVLGLLLFTLFNSSDVFLLLRMKSAGVSDTGTIGVYIFYNLVYAVVSYPLGILADKIGLKRVMIAGLLLFAAVYFCMGVSNNLYVFFGLFFLYGIYAGATEGISKAWISNITDRKDTATAIGTYTAFQSICTMIASSMAGLIWFKFGAAATFILTAAATVAVAVYFILLPKPQVN